jgi:hypothetical protein
MTSREQYYVQQVVEKYNTAVTQLNVVMVERDTAVEEVNVLKEELGRAYQEISALKGSNPFTPAELSLTEDGAGLLEIHPKTPAL